MVNQLQSYAAVGNNWGHSIRSAEIIKILGLSSNRTRQFGLKEVTRKWQKRHEMHFTCGIHFCLIYIHSSIERVLMETQLSDLYFMNTRWITILMISINSLCGVQVFCFRRFYLKWVLNAKNSFFSTEYSDLIRIKLKSTLIYQMTFGMSWPMILVNYTPNQVT